MYGFFSQFCLKSFLSFVLVSVWYRVGSCENVCACVRVCACAKVRRSSLGSGCRLTTLKIMASGKKSALLSSLADYGDDSEPDSESDIEETGKIQYKQVSI